MNPVDHPHGGVRIPQAGSRESRFTDNFHRVTTSILVRLLPSRDTPPPVKRRVLLLRAERVSSVVPRRQRNRGVEVLMVSLGWCYIGLLASIEGTAEGRRLVAQRASIMTFGAQNLKALSLCEDVRYLTRNDVEDEEEVRERRGSGCTPVVEHKTQQEGNLTHTSEAPSLDAL